MKGLNVCGRLEGRGGQRGGGVEGSVKMGIPWETGFGGFLFVFHMYIVNLKQQLFFFLLVCFSVFLSNFLMFICVLLSFRFIIHVFVDKL